MFPKPVYSSDGNVLAVFVGRLYTKGDSIDNAEFVLRSYLKEGLKFITRLEGFFAFGIADKTRHQLIVCRDHLGSKPLYYYQIGKNFVVSSSIKSLLQLEAPNIPNNAAIYSFLIDGWHYYNGDTFFKEVKELLPGHYAIFNTNKNSLVLHQYWKLEAATYNAKGTNCVAEFADLLKETIKKMLPETDQFATSLSGGLDSAAIASFAKEIADGRQELYSMVFQNLELDEENEEPYIREYERFTQQKIHYIRCGQVDWQELKDYVYFIEEPLPVLNGYVAYHLAKQIQKAGLKWILRGDGADIILWGQKQQYINYLKNLWLEKKLFTLFKEMLGYVVTRDYPNDLQKRITWVIRNMFISPISDEAYFDPQLFKSKPDMAVSPLDEITLATIVLVHNYRTFSTCNIEPMHPYLDPQIMEYAASLSPQQKIRRGITKYLLRKSVKGLIPEATRKAKTKLATSIPQITWLKNLRPEITAMLTSAKFKDRHFFNPPAILKAYDMFCKDKLRQTEKWRFTDLLWRIINIELWLEAYIDKN